MAIMAEQISPDTPIMLPETKAGNDLYRQFNDQPLGG
jgi:hypothetical protein